MPLLQLHAQRGPHAPRRFDFRGKQMSGSDDRGQVRDEILAGTAAGEMRTRRFRTGTSPLVRGLLPLLYTAWSCTHPSKIYGMPPRASSPRPAPIAIDNDDNGNEAGPSKRPQSQSLFLADSDDEAPPHPPRLKLT